MLVERRLFQCLVSKAGWCMKVAISNATHVWEILLSGDDFEGGDHEVDSLAAAYVWVQESTQRLCISNVEIRPRVEVYD